jgi:hypothetical protein
MNAETRVVSTPVYVHEVRQVGEALSNEVVTMLNSITEADQRVASLWASVRTGWLNANLDV